MFSDATRTYSREWYRASSGAIYWSEGHKKGNNTPRTRMDNLGGLAGSREIAWEQSLQKLGRECSSGFSDLRFHSSQQL